MNILKIGTIVSIFVVITSLYCYVHNNNKGTAPGFNGENYTIEEFETSNNISEVKNKTYSITKRVETSNNISNRNIINNSKNNSKSKIYIRYPKIINYTILEYGKYSDRKNPDYYIYLDVWKNRTVIFIYGGKKPFDYDLSVEKVVRYSRDNLTIYVKRKYRGDLVITSPYIVLEINDSVKNINVIYLDQET